MTETIEKKETRELNDMEREAYGNLQKRIAEGKSIFAADIKTREPVKEVPFSATSRHAFESANLALLLDSAYEKGFKNPRWVSQSAIKALQEKAHKKISIKAGEKSTKLFNANTGFYKTYFNVEQLKGDDVKELASAELALKDFDRNIHKGMLVDDVIKIINATPEQFLQHNQLKELAKGKDFAEKFVQTCRDDYRNAAKNADHTRQEKKELSPDQLKCKEEFNKRLDAIKAVDLTKPEPKRGDQKFVYKMAKALSEHPKNKDYAIKAMQEMLLEGKQASNIKGLVTRFAPMAAYDSEHLKKEDGKKYSAYVDEAIKADKNFQKQLSEAKSKEASR